MRKIQSILNKYFGEKLDPDMIMSFKVMIKHVNSKDSVLTGTPDGMEYIISNDKTHYDLIINDAKIQLVNSTAIVDIHVSDRVKNKVLARVRNNMTNERHDRIKRILSRKENTLDHILSKID